MKTILFVCTGNTCRSSMAEALLKSKLESTKTNDSKISVRENNIKVISAGTAAADNQKASPQAIEVMAEKDISLREHKSKPLSKEMIKEADLILTMTTNHKQAVIDMDQSAEDKVYTLKEYVHNLENSEDVLDEMNTIFQKIQVKREKFMIKNQKKLEELKKKKGKV